MRNRFREVERNFSDDFEIRNNSNNKDEEEKDYRNIKPVKTMSVKEAEEFINSLFFADDMC